MRGCAVPDRCCTGNGLHRDRGGAEQTFGQGRPSRRHRGRVGRQDHHSPKTRHRARPGSRNGYLHVPTAGHSAEFAALGFAKSRHAHACSGARASWDDVPYRAGCHKSVVWGKRFDRCLPLARFRRRQVIAQADPSQGNDRRSSVGPTVPASRHL